MDFILNPNLVLYLPLWKLDGSPFVSKDTYGRPCAVTGALWRPNGRWFDYIDDRIQTILPDYNLTANANVSLLAWINTNSSSDQGIMAIGSVYMCINLDALVFGARCFDGASKVASSGYTISKNTWYLLAGVFSGGTVDFLVNGDLVAADQACSNQVALNQHLFIGFGYVPAAAQFFSGLIGEVAIYNRALTPLEILRNYQATKWRYR